MGLISDLNNVIKNVKDAVNDAKAEKASANSAPVTTPVIADSIPAPVIPDVVVANTNMADDTIVPAVADETTDETSEEISDTVEDSDDGSEVENRDFDITDDVEHLSKSIINIIKHFNDIMHGKKSLKDIIGEEVNEAIHKPLPEWAKNIPNGSDRG